MVPKALDGESMTSKVERFCQASGGMLSYRKEQTSGPVHCASSLKLQKWLNLGYVDFAEIFRWFGEATIRVREAGLTASEGFDKICQHL